MTLHTISADAVTDLRRRVTGTIAYPGDPAYARLLHSHDTSVVHRPWAVVEPVDAADVAAVVAVAAAHELLVTPLATGHGLSVPVTDGVVVRTSALRHVMVDAEQRTAVVGAGATWADVVDATEPHGLAPVTTNGPGVGVVGSVLGGGVGPLSRSLGFAADHVVGLTVVTADATVRTVDPGSELGRALLGARDGLGVVVDVTLALPAAADMWAGGGLWVGDVADLLRRWRARAEAVPIDVTSSAAVVRIPDVGPALHVREVSASPPAVTDLVADLGPAVDAHPWAPTSLSAWLHAHGDATDPMPTWQRGIALAAATDETTDQVARLMTAEPAPPLLGVELRRLGGATTAERCDSIGGRDAQWLANVIALPLPALFDVEVPHVVDRLEAALEPWATGGTLLNFHGRATPDRPLDLALPADAATRVAALRAEIDPRNLFGHRAATLGS